LNWWSIAIRTSSSRIRSDFPGKPSIISHPQQNGPRQPIIETRNKIRAFHALRVFRAVSYRGLGGWRSVDFEDVGSTGVPSGFGRRQARAASAGAHRPPTILLYPGHKSCRFSQEVP
jgi:hypothetical protein